jgi:NitT/TauT family transport system permease protein
MIGAGLGFVLGVCIASVKVIRQALYPYAVAFQNTPRVAFAPVLLTLFGFDIWSKVALAAAICFFPTLLAVMVGIQTVDEDAKTVMRSYGASTWQMFRKLTLPAASPFIFAGLKLGMTFALIGAIVAEFVGAARGMGVLIETFNFQLDVAEAYAVVMALSIMGLALYGIMELLDRRVVFWIDR